MGAEMKRLVCYGDSNTYGYDARDVFGGRLPADQRWTDILARELGADVINCGLNGRTIPRYPRSLENDLRLIRRCTPIDFLIVMLGTNDILTDREPEDSAADMARLLSALGKELPAAETILCAPPMVSGLGEAYEARIASLSEAYAQIAKELGLRFCGVSSWPIALASDGVHFSPAGHRTFAEYLKKELMNDFDRERKKP